jgi:hypothetical protein
MAVKKEIDMRAISVPVDQPSPLKGADFSDAFRVRIIGPALDAQEAARLVIARQPSWVSALLVLRNKLVKPFGLNPGAIQAPVADSLGIFPVISRSASKLVLGIDDKHLDFRLIFSLSSKQDVTVTTFVKTHNALGRLYLALVLPFHKVIVPTMLARVNDG